MLEAETELWARRVNENTRAVYLLSKLVWATEPPKIEELMIDTKEATEKKEQTVETMEAVVRMWNTALGGTVVEVG